MRDLLDYPLGAVRSAFRSLVGWTAIMAITAIGGFDVAVCIRLGSMDPLWWGPFLIPYLTLSAFVCPPVLGAFMGTALGWSLGLIAESLRFRLVIAVVNGALWVAIGAWASLPFV